MLYMTIMDYSHSSVIVVVVVLVGGGGYAWNYNVELIHHKSQQLTSAFNTELYENTNQGGHNSL